MIFPLHFLHYIGLQKKDFHDKDLPTNSTSSLKHSPTQKPLAHKSSRVLIDETIINQFSYRSVVIQPLSFYTVSSFSGYFSESEIYFPKLNISLPLYK